MFSQIWVWGSKVSFLVHVPPLEHFPTSCFSILHYLLKHCTEETDIMMEYSFISISFRNVTCISLCALEIFFYQGTCMKKKNLTACSDISSAHRFVVTGSLLVLKNNMFIRLSSLIEMWMNMNVIYVVF